MAGSDPVETASFLLEILNGAEIMVAVKLSNESTSRFFRFNAVFEPGTQLYSENDGWFRQLSQYI
tara:strand:- start:10 stop:204 length:195 start_codon:yes stop_codon:yes gene_type:complete